MKKALRRIFAVSTALVLALALAACVAEKDFGLPDPAQFETGLEYLESAQRTTAFDTWATPAGDTIAGALLSGELGETTAFGHQGVMPAGYTGAGRVTAADGTEVVMPFADGIPDPTRIQAITVNTGDKSITLYKPSSDRPYWDVSAEGSDNVQSMITIQASAEEFAELDQRVLTILDEYTSEITPS